MVLLSAGLWCLRCLLVCAQCTKAAAYASEFEKGLFMSVLFLEYPKCSTCKKAKKWLDDHGVDYVDHDMWGLLQLAKELKLAMFVFGVLSYA